MSKVKAQYQNKSVAELKEIYLSPEGWSGENGEKRTPFSENGVRFTTKTVLAYQENGKWVIGTFGKYTTYLKKTTISINQNSLTFLKLDKNDGLEEMNQKRAAIVNESSTTGTHTLYQNSFMKNVAEYPVAGQHCHKSVYADNSVILMKLKRELTALSLKLQKIKRDETGGFDFLNSDEEDESLQGFTNAIIATLDEIGIHKNTTADGGKLDINIKELVGDLFYNTANATDKTKAQNELSTELSELIKILLQPTTNDVFSALSTYTQTNKLATGFKEAIDKTKGELHTCYNLFVNEYGDEFTNKDALEQETMMREKSIMYPGATTQAGGYPDILFVGKNDKLVYAAPTKKGMTMAGSFEGNQIVRHPLDIFYNMKQCFNIGAEDDISKFNWSDENIRVFKDYASNSEKWLKVTKGEESNLDGTHFAVLQSDQYKDFNLESNQIFPFPTRSTVDKMFKDAGEEMTDDELGEIYAHVFGKISGYVLSTNQSKDNALLMKYMHVANINETKMTFYEMVENVSGVIKGKLAGLFDKFKTDESQIPDLKLSGPQKDMLIIAGVILGMKYSELKAINPDAGSDLTSMLKGMATEEASQKADDNQAQADSLKADGRLKDLKAERLELSGIANDAILHLPFFPTKLFTQIKIRNKSVVEVVSGRETDAIRYLLVNASNKEDVINWLEESVPTFYPAYQAYQEAIGILKSMAPIYQEGTSKGELLKEFTEKLASEFPNEVNVDISNANEKEKLAEYVISMRFAQDMEEKTVGDIIKAYPLSEYFNEDDVSKILATITYRKNAKGNGQHKPIKIPNQD